MEPEKLRALLAVLTDAGVSRAKVPTDGGTLEVEFSPAIEAGPVQASPDDELPWNARDPDAAIGRANFDRDPKKR